VKAIACQDTHSVAVYKKVVAALGEAYPEAKLEVVDWDKVASKLSSRVWAKRILNLQVCNPDLPTAN